MAISDDGGDYTYYLATAQSGLNGEAPVVVLGPGANGVVVAAELSEFVARSLECTISF